MRHSSEDHYYVLKDESNRAFDFFGFGRIVGQGEHRRCPIEGKQPSAPLDLMVVVLDRNFFPIPRINTV